jgi:hypothetical protein
MSSVNIREIKEVVVDIIGEARGLILLSPSEVKFESIKKVNNGYEVSGVYEYKAIFSGEVTESGKFKIILDENLEIISVEITPTMERYK